MNYMFARTKLLAIAAALALVACTSTPVGPTTDYRTTGHCGPGAEIRSCEVAISYDARTRRVTLTPELLVVHFRGSKESVPIHWTIDRASRDFVAFRPGGGVVFKNLDGEAGPFHGARADYANNGRGGAATYTFQDECGAGCDSGVVYGFWLVLHDREGKAVQSPDPGIRNESR